MVEEIEKSGCEWCFAMQSLEVENLKIVDSRAFYACVCMLYFNASKVVTLSTESFAYCYNLKVVRLDSVKIISNACF